jgi:hypothetical protein
MARIASLSIWQNKNDQTVYYRGVKVFRGTPAEVTEFCDNFDFNGKRMSTNQFHALAEELGVDFGITENEAPVAQPASMNLTKRSIDLFVAYAEDADNWSGSPLVGGNVGGSKEDRGNLTQLKKAGLITTDYVREDDCTWINFTKMGIEYAAALGITINT